MDTMNDYLPKIIHVSHGPIGCRVIVSDVPSRPLFPCSLNFRDVVSDPDKEL